MAIELFCEVHGCELETYMLNKKVTVTPCSKCESDNRDAGYSDGCDSRDDEIASLQADLQNMVEQNEILQQQLNDTEPNRS